VPSDDDPAAIVACAPGSPLSPFSKTLIVDQYLAPMA
jgi:hypothetical protein